MQMHAVEAKQSEGGSHGVGTLSARRLPDSQAQHLGGHTHRTLNLETLLLSTLDEVGANLEASNALSSIHTVCARPPKKIACAYSHLCYSSNLALHVDTSRQHSNMKRMHECTSLCIPPYQAYGKSHGCLCKIINILKFQMNE